MNNFKSSLIFSALMIATLQAWSYEPKAPVLGANETPKSMQEIAIEEKIGTDLDLNLQFKNEEGQIVSLKSFYDEKVPVIVSLVYFGCPGLCNFHLNGLVGGLKDLNWTPNQQYRVVAISFDDREDHELAASKKASYLKEFGRGENVQGFHFLTGDKSTIQALTQSVGFKYKWNESAKEWSHSSAAIITTPNGKVARYLHGVIFQPQDLRLAINEAAHGKMGGVLDRVLFYCMKYDSSASKYTLYSFRIMQVGALVTIIVIAFLLIPNLRRRYS